MPRLMNTRSLYTERNKNVTTQWLQNATKTLGMSGLDAIKEISPAIYDVAENTGKAAQTIFRQLRRNSTKQKTLLRLIDNNQYVKLARKGLKNITDDLKTGNFNNTERAEQALLSGEEDTTTSTYFGDDGASYPDSGAGISASVAGLATVADSVKHQTQSQVKMTEATINSIVAVSGASMMQQQQLGDQILGHLANINTGIQSLVAYQNENMTKFIESSIAYYETMGKAEQSAQDAGNSKSYDKWDILQDSKKGLKIGNYTELVKKQFKSYFEGTSIGQFSTMVKTEGDTILANPLGLITTELIKKATPEDLKNAIKSVDKTFADFVPEMMHQLYSKWGNVGGTGAVDNIKRMIGNTFGLRMQREKSFNTSNKVTADPVQFDGITRNTITEIIPKYLREQSGYLKEITTILGGNTKKAIAESEMFDIEEGIYRSFNEMQKSLMQKIDDSIAGAFNSTEFGKTLNASGSGLNEKDAETYQNLLSRFYSTLEKMDDIEHLDLSRKEDVDTVFAKLNPNHDFSDNMMRLLEEGIKSAYKLNDDGSDNGGLSLNSAIFKSRLARNKRIESISKDAYSNGLFSLQGRGKDGEAESIDESMVSVLYGTSSALSSNDKRKGSLIDKLDNIQFLLNRGINVKILEGMNGFDDYLGNGSSGDTERADDSGNHSQNNNNNNNPPIVVNPNSDIRSIDEMTPEEIAALVNGNPEEQGDDSTDENEGRRKLKFTRFVQNKSKKLNTAMQYIAHGKIDMGMGELSSLLGDGVRDIVTNTKNALIGDRDDEGKLKGGLFSKAINRFKEEGSSITTDVLTEIRHGIFGYTDEHGEKHKGVGVVSAGTDIIKKGFEGWKDIIFGPETELEDAKKQIKESIEKRSRVIVKGALAGGTLGIAAGGLLGTLIGGPISGALLGSAAGYVSGNKKFQKFLFGDEITEEITDENGDTKVITKRTGGLISQKTQEFFKKNKTAAIGGAVLGGLKGMIGGGGLLGAFVGGPIAGALMGTGIALAAKSEKFQNFIFGKEELDEEGNKKRIGGILNSFNKVFKKNNSEDASEDSDRISRKIGMTGIGTGAGLLAGLFTPLGPIGGAALGLASSMYASKDRFREFLFGDEENDEPGLVKRLGNIMTVEVLVPIKNSMKNWLEDMKTAAIEKVMQPIEIAMGPIANMGKRIYDKTLGKIADGFTLIGERIRDAVSNAAENIRKAAIGIVTKPFKLFGRALTGLFKAGAGVMGGVVKKVGNFAEKSNRKASYAKAKKEKLNKDPELITKWKREAREAGVSYAEYEREQMETFYYNNRDISAKRKAHREENAKRKEENKKRREEAAQIEKRNQLVSRLTGGKFDASSEEGVQLAINNYMTSRSYKNNKKKYGLTPEEMLDILSTGKNSSESREISSQILSTSEAQLHAEEQQLSKLGEILSHGIDFKNAVIHSVQNIGEDLKYWADEKKDMRKRGKRGEENERLGVIEAVENSRSAEEYLENRGDMTAEEYREERGVVIEDTTREKIGKVGKAALNTIKTKGPTGMAVKAGKYVKKSIKDAAQVSRTRERVRENRNRLFNIADDDEPERGYASGTNSAKPGVAVVGEDGPELIRFGGGEMVQNGRKPINVIIEGITKDAANKMNEQPDKPLEVSVVSANGALPTFVAGTLDRYTDNINKISKKIDGKGLITYDDIDDDIHDNEGRAEEKEEKQESLFDKISNFFGKFDLGSLIKNLAIVGTAVAGLVALLNNGGFSGLGDTLKDALNHLKDNAEHGQESLGDEKTSAEVVDDVKEDFNDLKSGNVGGFILNDDGEVDHTTGSKVKALTRVGARIIAGKNGKRAQAVAKGLKSASKKLLQTGVNGGSKSSLAAMKLFHGADEAVEAAQKAGVKMSKKATKSAAKKAGVEVAEGASKGLLSKIWTFVKKGITTMGEKASKLLGKKAPKFVQKATSFFDDILKKLAKPAASAKGFVSKGLTKIASFLGINTGIAATGVGAVAILAKDALWIGVGALANASNTAIARLFRCDESVVDGKMRAIAMCIGAIAGTTAGTVIDMLNEIITQITGVDMLSELATLLYNVFASDEEYANLEESQNAQKEEYNAYKEDKIQEAYEKYLVDNNLSADELSREDYEQLVESGDASVEYDSYADWNDKKHEGLLSKAGRSIVNGASKAWSGVKNAASTVKEKAGAVVDYGKKTVTKTVATAKTVASVVKDKAGNIIDYGKEKVASTVAAVETLKEKGKEYVSNMFSGISNVGKEISSTISSFLDSSKNIGELKKSAITSLSQYVLGKRDSIDFGVGDNSPISGVAGIIEKLAEFILFVPRKIGSFFTGIVDNAGEIIGTVKDKLGSVLEKFGFGGNGDKDTKSSSTDFGGRGEIRNGVPYYSQKDSRWKNIPYEETGRGDTIGNSGCGPAAFAMAASKETGKDINPVQASRVMKAVGARDNTGTSWRGMSRTANAYGLRSVMSRKPSSKFIDSQLASGHPVVLSGRSGGYGNNTPYTKAGHYVVATGIDSNGNYEISDPNGKSTSKSYNKKDILQETGAAWSFGGRGPSTLMPTFPMTPSTTTTSTLIPTKTAPTTQPSALIPTKEQTTTTSNTANTATVNTTTASTTNGNMFALAPSWTSAGKSATKAAAEVATNTAAAQQGIQSNLDAASSESATDRERWLAIVKSVKSAIAAQSPGYSQSRSITINVGGVQKSVRTDCSGFVSACLKYYGVLNDNANLSSRDFANASNTTLSSANFTHSAWNGWESLSPGDIIAINGHVEIFAGNDGGHKVYNCGSDKSVNSAGATGSAKSSYTDVWSPGPAGANAVTGTSVAGATASEDGSSNGGFWSKVTSFFSELGSRAVEGITTGNWNSDWSDWMSKNGVNPSGATSTGSNSDATITPANINGSDTAKNVWDYFTSNGYTKEATAGIMGNLQQESTMNPAAIQSGSGKAAGIAQWENYKTKSSRWKQLSDYAASKGKDWTDLGSQLEFMEKELRGLGIFWGDTKGMRSANATPTSYEEFKQSKDIAMATRQFEGAFERAGTPHMENRLSYAQAYYDKYANSNTTNTTEPASASPWDDAYKKLHGGGYGNASVDDDYDRFIVDEPTGDEMGGYGNPSVENIRDTQPIPNTIKPTTYSVNKLSTPVSGNEYWKQAIELLNTVTELLSTANGNLESISGGISKIPTSNNINNIDNRTVNNSTSNHIGANGSKISIKGYNTAATIAKGGL